MQPVPAGRDLIEEAARYASRVHAGDVRKGSGLSYFAGHLQPVADLVRDAGGDAVQIAAAYLHDAAEDHGGHRRLDDIRRRFGADVAGIVADLSDSLVDTEAGAEKAPWRTRKEQYLATLPAKPHRSLLVACADKLHNARSIVADHRELGAEIWQRFTTRRAEDQRWYYRALAATLATAMPGHPLTGALTDTVEELSALVAADLPHHEP